MHLALSTGKYEVVNILLDKGADVNKADKDVKDYLLVAKEKLGLVPDIV